MLEVFPVFDMERMGILEITAATEVIGLDFEGSNLKYNNKALLRI